MSNGTSVIKATYGILSTIFISYVKGFFASSRSGEWEVNSTRALGEGGLGDALGFTVMFRNSDYFYFVLRQRDKQRPIFLVYSE